MAVILGPDTTLLFLVDMAKGRPMVAQKVRTKENMHWNDTTDGAGLNEESELILASVKGRRIDVTRLELIQYIRGLREGNVLTWHQTHLT